MPSTRMPTFFIPHGGGPWPWLGEGGRKAPKEWMSLDRHLRGIAGTLPVKAEAIVIISAHWEAPVPTILGNLAPPLLFDYSGFPEHTYALKYPAPGSRHHVDRVRALLGDAGIDAPLDMQRGYDHGVFVPLSVMYPEPSTPVVQLSLKHGLDAREHLAIGRALAPLRDERVLILGSGMSYHNMRGFFAATPESDMLPATQFDAWLRETLAERRADVREARLVDWQQAPNALDCHPRSEHLTPLFVAAGAGYKDDATCVYHNRLLGAAVSGFRFG